MTWQPRLTPLTSYVCMGATQTKAKGKIESVSKTKHGMEAQRLWGPTIPPTGRTCVMRTSAATESMR